MKQYNDESPKKPPSTSPSGERFLAAKEAAKFVSYTPDYISRLAREGKVVAEQHGRQWFVSLDSLKHFMLEQQAEQRSRQESLRAKRLQEYARTQLTNQEQRAVTPSTLPALAGIAVAMLCLLLVATLGWVGYQERLQVAELFSGAAVVQERLLDALPFVSRLRERTAQSREVTVEQVVPDHRVRITQNGVEVTEGTALAEAVSDPVTAQVVSSSTLVLTPVFATSSEAAYVVELVPRGRSTSSAQRLQPRL